MIKLNEYNYNYAESVWEVNGRIEDDFYCQKCMFEDIATLVDNEYMTKEQAYDYLQGTMYNIMLLLTEYKEMIEEDA